MGAEQVKWWYDLPNSTQMKRGNALPMVNHEKINHKWKLDPGVAEDLKAEKYKQKHHPGIRKLPAIMLPLELRDAMAAVNQRSLVVNREEKSIALFNYLWSRLLPHSTFGGSFSKDTEQIQVKDAVNMTHTEERVYKENVEKKVLKKLRARIYNWKPVEYNAVNSVLYMNGKLLPDYACLYKIFTEISKRVPHFHPETLFDFGSGVGSSVWAANAIWKETLKEHYCVDTSEDMNKLAALLLQGGDEEGEMCYPGVHFRQYFPFSTTNKYDLVISAFSLFELESLEERLLTLQNLWKKTQHFMIVVENGTKAGFRVITEARNLIHKMSGDDELQGHIFAPCPHHVECPRTTDNTGIPCNFLSRYTTEKEKRVGISHQANYTYIILRKGTSTEIKWPRLIRQPTVKSKHTHCWMCTACGELEHAVFTQAKHRRDLYRCARNSNYGDLLPVVPDIT